MHINQITTKANHTLLLLQRNIKLAPKKTKELVYKSLVRSQFEYASTVWSPWQNALIKSLQKFNGMLHDMWLIIIILIIVLLTT